MSNLLSVALNDIKTAAISGHVRPDGDCVGSCMGLYHYLKENYSHLEVDVYLEPIPDAYKLVKGTDIICSQMDGDKCYDLFIALDCGDVL